QASAEADEVARAVGDQPLGGVDVVATEGDHGGAGRAAQLGGVPRQVTHTVRGVGVGGGGCDVGVGIRRQVDRVHAGLDGQPRDLGLLGERLADVVVVFPAVEPDPDRVVGSDRAA